jgi:membrane-associated PAP2 superfamily phosphatase
MLTIDLPLALFGCFSTCASYAALLSTKRGQRFNLRYTWATVVVGVLLVLAWTATQGDHNAGIDLLFFVAGGSPMIFRSWYLDQMHEREHVAWLRKQQGE